MNILRRNNLSILVLALFSMLSITSVQARDYQFIATGLGGNDDYSARFTAAFDDIVAAFAASTMGGDGNPETLRTMDAKDVSKEAILSELADLATSLAETDTLTVILVGHGTYDGEHYKFNIPGPDLTGQELKNALAEIKASRQLVVLATSASGVMLKTLEQEGRIVVTATKSGGEINGVAFPIFWAEALASDAADIDKNEIVTADEAFRFAENQVALYYTDEGLLATEHPRLEGENAAGLSLMRIGALRDSQEDPVVNALLEDRSELEVELAVLRAKKSDLPRDEYFDDLEALMLRMATLQQSIDAATGWVGAGE
ncbi:MAG: hypothetical protein KTR33_05140, partial [Gammaproteobacteria bacterium]|nr:hypothetical protein [Gammaproteobacteria bacterium]